MRKTILITLVAFLVFAAAAAAKTPRYYVPRPHHTCRLHYVKHTVRIPERRHGKIVRRHHKIVTVKQTRCVHVAPTSAKPNPPASTAPTVRYSARVDPSFVQSPDNPLSITYSFSADATATVNGVTTDLASTGALPDGVLNLYTTYVPGQPASPIGIGLPPNGESLICAIDIGGSTAGGSCPTTYQTTGTYQVTTQAIWSTTNSVTQTDSETISPYGTQTALTSASSNGQTLYGASVGDDHGNTVPAGPNDLGLSITDATTGQQVGTFPTSSAGDSFSFAVHDDGGHGEIVIIEDGYASSYSLPVSVHDSFTIQAVYRPAWAGSGWAGSASATQPLVPSGS
jgi:hypothetical protein